MRNRYWAEVGAGDLPRRPISNPLAGALHSGRNVQSIQSGYAAQASEVGGMATPDQATSAVNGESADLVAYETLDEGRIARIWLNRPEAHNAQNRTLLVQLDEAFARAEADDDVRVVILAARGKNFSAVTTWARRRRWPNAGPGRGNTRRFVGMAPPATRSRRRPFCRNGTSISRTPAGGGICGKSPSPRSRATRSQRG
jgi:hypothetical protein